jgi:hypothetical protein
MLTNPFIASSSTYRLPNGLRYLLVGGTRERRFDETSLKPRKVPENAQTPTTMAPMLFGDRVHAVLGAGLFRSLTIKLHHCLYAHCST